MSLIVFGPYRMSLTQRRLFRGNTPIRLGCRAREMLAVLLEKAGEIVSTRELLERVWPRTIVEVGTVRVHMTLLRKMLKDPDDKTSYVENVRGHGYRFTAPCNHVPEPSGRMFDDAQYRSHILSSPLPAGIVGRSQTIAQLKARLSTHRFITLVGPAGVGKSTVAAAAAATLGAHSDLSADFVDVASSAMGTRLNFGWSGSPLLVLDNCDERLDATAFWVEQALGQYPGLTILATAREPLRARCESVMRIQPLAVPDQTAQITAREALMFSAVQLFVERANESTGDFNVKDENAADIARICQQLDGLPLAIELAAAQVHELGLPDLSVSGGNLAKLLTRGSRAPAGRQQCLGATLDRSYYSLSPEEQLVLRRAAVFPRDFSPAAGAAVIGGERIPATRVKELLTTLAAKSLMQVHSSERGVKFHLLNISRIHALTKFQCQREYIDVHRRLMLLNGPIKADMPGAQPPMLRA